MEKCMNVLSIRKRQSFDSYKPIPTGLTFNIHPVANNQSTFSWKIMTAKEDDKCVTGTKIEIEEETCINP